MRVFVESTGFARLGPGRRSARPRGRDATWRWATAIARARPGWTRDARTRRPRQTRRARSRSPSTTRPFRVSPRRGDYLDEKRNPLPSSNVVRGGRSIDPRRRRLDTILPRGSLRRARVLSRCAIRSCVRRVSLVRARASLRRARASRDEINSGWWVGIKSTPAWVTTNAAEDAPRWQFLTGFRSLVCASSQNARTRVLVLRARSKSIEILRRDVVPRLRPSCDARRRRARRSDHTRCRSSTRSSRAARPCSRSTPRTRATSRPSPPRCARARALSAPPLSSHAASSRAVRRPVSSPRRRARVVAELHDRRRAPRGRPRLRL